MYSLKNKKKTVIKSVFILALAAVTAAGVIFSAFGASEKSFAMPQLYYDGVDSGVVAFKYKEGEVSVKSETVTFDIFSENLQNYCYGTNKAGTVTASYELVNEGKTAAKVGLLFPFGRKLYHNPDISDEDYVVKKNGVETEKKIRHSFQENAEEFDIIKDSSRLYDGYKEDVFYSPDLKVYKREYSVEQTDTENFVFGFSVGKSEERTIMADVAMYQSSYGETRVYGRIKDNKFTVYFLGKDREDFHLKVKIYKSFDTEYEKPNEAAITPLSVTETTFGEIVEESRIFAKAEKVSKEDWYNAVIAYIYASDKDLTEPSFDIVSNYLLRWYEYELDFAAGETLVNEVVAPLYPSENGFYSPKKYTFVYLVSPAKTWKSFGSLTVKINTDIYLLRSEGFFAASDFTKTDAGYEAKYETLPEGELVFTLCASQNPERVIDNSLKGLRIFLVIFAIIGTLAVLSVPVAGVILLMVYHKNLKKKNAEKAGKENSEKGDKSEKTDGGAKRFAEQTEKENDKRN